MRHLAVGWPLKRFFEIDVQRRPNSGASWPMIIAAILLRPFIEKPLTPPCRHSRRSPRLHVCIQRFTLPDPHPRVRGGDL